jgi:hypothetical protein
MSSSNTALITEMAILVGIFLLGFIAKMFPKRAGNEGSREQGTKGNRSAITSDGR